MNLANRIQIRLQKLAKTERRASLEAGLSDSFLRNIRQGKSKRPRIDTLEKIAVVLKTSSKWLISGEGEEDVELSSSKQSDLSHDTNFEKQKVSNSCPDHQLNSISSSCCCSKDNDFCLCASHYSPFLKGICDYCFQRRFVNVDNDIPIEKIIQEPIATFRSISPARCFFLIIVIILSVNYPLKKLRFI